MAAALDGIGGLLGVAEFPTTMAGHRKLLGWLSGFGPVARAGVEGTGSYGAGLARAVGPDLLAPRPLTVELPPTSSRPPRRIAGRNRQRLRSPRTPHRKTEACRPEEALNEFGIAYPARVK